MSTLSAHVIDLATYYETHEGLDGTELETHVSRLRSLHPYAVGVELSFGESVVGAWVEVKPFEGIISEDELSRAQSTSDLPEGAVQAAIDRSVAVKLASIMFPSPYSAS